MTAIPESITEAELAAAFGRLPLPGLYGGGEAELAAAFGRLPLPGLYGGGKMAASLVADVLAHREPEYEPGEAYADARGDKYLRSSSGGWVDYSTTWHPHELPQRPLRKLVPEGSREAAAVLVAEWRGLGEQDDAVPEWRGGYRAALRKCADELGYALKEGQQ
jgi:hypothetical protein